MSEICCDLCKFWLPELKECGNTHIDKCTDMEYFIKTERNCVTCEREIYNEALDDYSEKLCFVLEEYQTGFNMVSMANVWHFSKEVKEELTK